MTKFTVKQGAVGRVQVGDRLVPRKFWVEVENADGSPDLRVDLEVRDGAVQCRAVHVISSPDGREVQSTDLRGVRIQDLLEDATARVAPRFEQRQDGSTAVKVLATVDTDDLRRTVRLVRQGRRAARQKLTDDMLRQVAAIYRGHAGNDKAQAVADHYEKEVRTARMYLQQARQRIDPETGKPFLGAAIKGKAGER